MTYIPFTPTHQHVEILQTVREHLMRVKDGETDDYSYICPFISFVHPNKYFTQKDDLRKWIDHMIQPWSTVATWLRNEAGIPYGDLLEHNLITYRIEWIEHLIQILKEQIS